METNHAIGGSSRLLQGEPGQTPPGTSGANGANSERLLVEFVVERTDDIGYGIQAKYLKYHDQRLKYKAVVKGGRVVAIVTRRYKVIPNEKVLGILSKLMQADKAETTETRLVWVAKLDETFAVRVVNSIDGTLALSVSLLVFGVPLRRAVVERFDVKQVYRRHFDRLNEADILVKSIEQIKQFVAEFGNQLREYLAIRVDDVVVQSFAQSKLPKKYLNGLNAYVGKPLGELVSSVTRKIWSADLNPLVRQAYLEELAAIVWEVVLSKNP